MKNEQLQDKPSTIALHSIIWSTFKSHKKWVISVGVALCAVIGVVAWLALGVAQNKPSQLTNPSAAKGQLKTQPKQTPSAPSTAAPGPAVNITSWWKPGTESLPWQWELQHAINLANPQDAGGNPQPIVYDIDGFDNTAANVASIHARNAKAICYIEVGAIENYRPDYASFPKNTIGNNLDNYPDERYLNIANPTVVNLIKNRIKMCHDKGFDGVEPDIDDSYADNTGFNLSVQDEVRYLTQLSDYAHSLGMGWGLKNGGDSDNTAQFINDMLPHVDFAVVEEPYFLRTIQYFYPTFFNAGKAVFAAEYTENTENSASFCSQAIANHVNAALFDINLDGSTRVACR